MPPKNSRKRAAASEDDEDVSSSKKTKTPFTPGGEVLVDANGYKYFEVGTATYIYGDSSTYTDLLLDLK